MGVCHSHQPSEFPQDRIRHARPDRRIIWIEPARYGPNNGLSNGLLRVDHERTVASLFVSTAIGWLGYCHANRPDPQ